MALTACGGGAAPASSPPVASSPPAAVSKPAAASSAASVAASAAASAKPAASAAASASAKPVASGAAASAAASAKPAASAAPAASSAATALPPIPAPVPVSVDAKTSAFLSLDFNNAACQPTPACVASLPTVAAFLKKARDGKMPVVHSTFPSGPNTNSPTMAEVAPAPGEQTVSARADKFIGSDLDAILKKTGAQTLVVTGTYANGAVLYTSFHANALSYTVAVAVDGISSPTPVATTLAEWQLLNQPGSANPDNKPLADKMVTLTKTDLITIK